MKDEELKEKLVAMARELKEQCEQPDANPHIILRRFELAVEDARHDLIVAGKRG